MRYTIENIDGNAFVLMGYVGSAMKKERFPNQVIEEYYKEAKSADYNNLVVVTLNQLEKVNNFVEFWEEFNSEFGYTGVDKRIAVEYFLKHAPNTDLFYDYVLANGLEKGFIYEQEN